MDPIKTYDYLARTRGRIFDAVRPLDAERYAQELPIGPGTLGRILTHIMISEWYYMQRMQGLEVPPYEQWPIKDEEPPPFATLEATWAEQAAETRAALSAVRDWTTPFEYRVTSDEGREQIVTASAADLFTQLVLHEVHHRAQTLNILRHQGVEVGELDYNAFFERRDAPA